MSVFCGCVCVCVCVVWLLLLLGVAECLVVLVIPEEICAPVDEVEQCEHERERYPRDYVDSLRSRTLT